ncbi:2-hydroxy-3-oxopropionate reductase [uncultured Martelella sp.]|uniref:2-hydroxy-3-oxopropionate reductase n=1 Tax=uncultured Martelella sp. TaxID=392331 RepID=UPI0029C886C0|nr:2-hydroxy-3-oxopropionate reductase [uncultured Martelella sp.]
MTKIGFVGLGIMGTQMAGRLADAGHELFAYDRKQLADSLAAKGITACASSKEVAEKCEVFISIVPDTPDVGAVLFGENGAAEGLSAGKIVIDMSSISPVETKEYAAKIEALGCEYVDAPVSGGEVGARDGTLSIMVGAKDEVFEKVKPLFEIMGKNVTLVGAVGAGQTAKVANQMIVAMNIEAVGEALLFAARAGVDPERVRQAISGGFASSKILELHGERMIKRTFDPGFRINLHQKDLNLALTAGRQMGLSLPNTATCQELFNACAAHGGSAWDHSGMVKALELLADFEIGQD